MTVEDKTPLKVEQFSTGGPRSSIMLCQMTKALSSSFLRSSKLHLQIALRVNSSRVKRKKSLTCSWGYSYICAHLSQVESKHQNAKAKIVYTRTVSTSYVGVFLTTMEAWSTPISHVLLSTFSILVQGNSLINVQMETYVFMLTPKMRSYTTHKATSLDSVPARLLETALRENTVQTTMLMKRLLETPPLFKLKIATRKKDQGLAPAMPLHL
jgi:hypothetical protein